MRISYGSIRLFVVILVLSMIAFTGSSVAQPVAATPAAPYLLAITTSTFAAPELDPISMSRTYYPRTLTEASCQKVMAREAHNIIRDFDASAAAGLAKRLIPHGQDVLVIDGGNFYWTVLSCQPDTP